MGSMELNIVSLSLFIMFLMFYGRQQLPVVEFISLLSFSD